MIEPTGITMIPCRMAREIAGEDPVFDLFDPPTDTGGLPSPPRDSGFRPVAIALPSGVLTAESTSPPRAAVLVWGHHRVRAVPAEAFIPAVLIDTTGADTTGAGTTGAGTTGADTTGGTAVDGRELLLLALAMENRPGRYSWAELDRICGVVASLQQGKQKATPRDALFAQRLAAYLDPERDPCPLLSRYRQLPEVLQDALEEHTVDMRTAERVAVIEPAVMRALLELGASLSFSRRRQFLTACNDLLRRGGNGQDLVQTLREVEPNRRFDLVMEQRYPRLRRMQDAVERVRKTTLRGTGISLEPPPHFEGDRYRISFEVRSTAELKKRLNAVQELEKELDDLLGLLFQDDLDDPLAP